MLIICDYRASNEAIKNLESIGKVFLFKNNFLHSMPLHGHPDIFMCKTPEKLILAPNIDKETLDQLSESNTPYVFGNLPVETQHPFIARYNAVVTNKAIICNSSTVDSKILELYPNNRVIDVKQSYNRCSTIALSDDSFLTSDAKTHQKLIKNGFESLLIDPKTIRLDGYSHGLFGGCAGLCNVSSTLYVMGELKTLPNYQEIATRIEKLNLSVVCLTSSSLHDVGGLFFFN